MKGDVPRPTRPVSLLNRHRTRVAAVDDGRKPLQPLRRSTPQAQRCSVPSSSGKAVVADAQPDEALSEVGRARSSSKRQTSTSDGPIA